MFVSEALKSESARLPENQIRQKQAKSRQLRHRNVGRAPVAQGDRESSNNSRTQEGQVNTPYLDRKPVGSFCDTEEADLHDELEPPSGGIRNYDWPQKKKEKGRP